MNTNELTRRYEKRLADFAFMSVSAGARPDYVQGGGGNTSCKLDARWMAIKASGFRLDQISADQGYAVLDYAALRDFYEKTDPAGLDDIEKQGSLRAAAATETIEGLAAVRPSVEAGFHSLLENYVLHTHSVYANLAACSVEGPDRIGEALRDLPVVHATVPYMNPGAQLTFSIGAARQAAKVKTGRFPEAIFLENHGLIITGDTAGSCLALNDLVNERIARAFGTNRADWPEIRLEEAAAPEGLTGARWVSATSWLKERLLRTKWDLDFFTRQALYPDQIVFLNGQVGIAEKAGLADMLASGKPLDSKCTLFPMTGEACYQCAYSEAKTIEETLCAVLFIHEKIGQAGCTVKTMNEAGKAFIRNWESEQYRRQVAAKSEKQA